MVRVVIAEDDALIASALRFALDMMGHEVVAAVDTGPNAVRSVFRYRPDLVITDGKLAEGTCGVVAAARISELGVPVILASASVDEATAIDAGADAFVQKPFSLDKLRQTVNGVLASAVPNKKRQLVAVMN